MKINKIFRIAASAVGFLLIAGAIVLFLTTNRNPYADVDTDAAVSFFAGIMPDRQNGVKEGLSHSSMPAISYAGIDYVGILEFPRFDSTLPVASSWNNDLIKSTPAHYTGNPYDGTLSIGGVDSQGQLDFISSIDIGDNVKFTDLKGNEFSYNVKTVKHSKKITAEKIIDDQYDLTIFAHDRNSGDYLLVRCSM